MGRRQLLSGSMRSVLLLVSFPSLGTVCGRCACFTWLMSSDDKEVTFRDSLPYRLLPLILGDECQGSATTTSRARDAPGPPLSAVSKQYWIAKTD